MAKPTISAPDWAEAASAQVTTANALKLDEGWGTGEKLHPGFMNAWMRDSARWAKYAQNIEAEELDWQQLQMFSANVAVTAPDIGHGERTFTQLAGDTDSYERTGLSYTQAGSLVHLIQKGAGSTVRTVLVPLPMAVGQRLKAWSVRCLGDIAIVLRRSPIGAAAVNIGDEVVDNIFLNKNVSHTLATPEVVVDSQLYWLRIRLQDTVSNRYFFTRITYDRLPGGGS